MAGFAPFTRTGAFLLVMAATLGLPLQAQDQEASFADAFDDIRQPILPLQSDGGAVDITEITAPIDDGAHVVADLGDGIASFYGRRFHGRLTANGEVFDMDELTAAHRTLPFGSIVRVTNPQNGRTVTVRINDRGPFVEDRVIDLSRAAAREIGLIHRGHAPVQLQLVE